MRRDNYLLRRVRAASTCSISVCISGFCCAFRRVAIKQRCESLTTNTAGGSRRATKRAVTRNAAAIGCNHECNRVDARVTIESRSKGRLNDCWRLCALKGARYRNGDISGERRENVKWNNYCYVWAREAKCSLQLEFQIVQKFSRNIFRSFRMTRNFSVSCTNLPGIYNATFG